MATKTRSSPLKVGDHVRIRHSDNMRGRIVEFRGPLGPGGMLIYRVRIPNKPKATYIELREDQLVALPTPPRLEPSALETPPSTMPQPPTIKRKKARKGK